jgi:hypothetical protein
MDVLVLQYCIALSAKHPTQLLTQMLERYKVNRIAISHTFPVFDCTSTLSSMISPSCLTVRSPFSSRPTDCALCRRECFGEARTEPFCEQKPFVLYAIDFQLSA